MSIKFGWSEVDITPTEKIALFIEFFERVTNEVETPITVTAFAVEAGQTQAVFCSCDLEGIYDSLLLHVRRKLNVPGLDPMNVMLNAVHNHNSYTVANPDADPRKKFGGVEALTKMRLTDCEYIPEESDPDQMDPLRALDIVSDKIVEAVTNAWNRRQEGCFATGFGRAAVGMCRRVCYSDDTAKMWGDSDDSCFTELENGNDSGIEMLFTYDPDHKLTGVIANVACPSQVMEQRSVISGDYWGKLRILLREKYGKEVCLLPLCSPAGDQCPRDLVRWVQPETPIKDPNIIRNHPKPRRADPSMFDVKGTWTIGRRLMNEIDFALGEVTEYKTEAVFRHKIIDLPLPLRCVTENEKLRAENTIKEFFKGKTVVNYTDMADMFVYAGIIDRYEQQKRQSTVPTEVHVLRFDDVAFATSPFELFLNYGNRIRARSHAAQTFLIQLCQGAYGYLPTEAAERHGHYSAYVSSGLVGHEGGDMLVAATLDTIKELFDK